MKLSSFFVFVFLFFGQFSAAQNQILGDSVTYDLFGEGHALMCPFLSPQLISRIKQDGGRSFIRTSDYHILFKTSGSEFIPASRILDIVQMVGYERKNFTLSYSGLNE
jgi:hypothetical protein